MSAISLVTFLFNIMTEEDENRLPGGATKEKKISKGVKAQLILYAVSVAIAILPIFSEWLWLRNAYTAVEVLAGYALWMTTWFLLLIVAVLLNVAAIIIGVVFFLLRAFKKKASIAQFAVSLIALVIIFFVATPIRELPPIIFDVWHDVDAVQSGELNTENLSISAERMESGQWYREGALYPTRGDNRILYKVWEPVLDHPNGTQIWVWIQFPPALSPSILREMSYVESSTNYQRFEITYTPILRVVVNAAAIRE